MVPDLVYFLPGFEQSDSHSLAGVLRFCLPFGLLGYVVFHTLITPLAFALLPESIRQRVDVVPQGRVPSWDPIALLLCLGLGALSHVLWDSFTHPNELPARFPILFTSLGSWGGHALRLYKAIQHGSTVLGIAVLFFWLRHWMRSTPAVRDIAPRFSPVRKWGMLAMILTPPLLAAVVAARPALSANIGSLRTMQLFVALAVIAGGRVLILSVLVTTSLWRLARRDGDS